MILLQQRGAVALTGGHYQSAPHCYTARARRPTQSCGIPRPILRVPVGAMYSGRLSRAVGILYRATDLLTTGTIGSGNTPVASHQEQECEAYSQHNHYPVTISSGCAGFGGSFSLSFRGIHQSFPRCVPSIQQQDVCVMDPRVNALSAHFSSGDSTAGCAGQADRCISGFRWLHRRPSGPGLSAAGPRWTRNDLHF